MFFFYSRYQIIVLGKPSFLSYPKNDFVVLDQSACFQAVVDANPKAKITWLLNGKELTAKDNIKLENDEKKSLYSLIIPKVKQSHSGKYSIKATNSIGMAECEFNIEILGKT